MNRDTTIWLILFVVGGVFLALRAAGIGSEYGMGKIYVETEVVDRIRDPERADAPGPDLWISVEEAEEREIPIPPPDSPDRISWPTVDEVSAETYFATEATTPNQTQYELHGTRTFGTWLAALFTLAIFSFLWRDNPFYKIAEAVVVGVSAAYWMVVGFWTTIVPNLLAKLAPDLIASWALPGLYGSDPAWSYIFPLVLGIMLLMRLSPAGAWISRWPLAFIIGTTAGARLIAFLDADFRNQIRNAIKPIFVSEAGTFDPWDSLRNLLLFLGTLAALVYFFFSIEHKGAVGKVARVGIWVLMITFGAAFGYTVMGRIALLADRLEFLFEDWLWINNEIATAVDAATEPGG